MEIPESPIHTPRILAESLNAGPVDSAAWRGDVILVDFWDYSCVNCLRTLPYVAAWDRKYRAAGLHIVGVHAPEFSFARRASHVREAVARLGIVYPVVLDNDYALWQRFANRAWPAKYLIDGRGYLRLRHLGEGAYAETEWTIQELLRERRPDYEAPPLLPPLRDLDLPGAVCYPTTPELYLGHQRARLGNKGGLRADAVAHYKIPRKVDHARVYLEGNWFSAAEYVEFRGEPGSERRGTPSGGAMANGRIRLPFQAAEVNVVLEGLQGAARVAIALDGQALSSANSGGDVCEGMVRVEAPRLYNIVRMQQFGDHVLDLTTTTPGLAAYAFTFGSCPIQR